MSAAYFLTFYSSARAFGLKVPLGEFLAFMPAVDIISALPISLGGFGVREQLFATVLDDLRAAAQAVSISLGGASHPVLRACSAWPCCRLITGSREARQGMSSPLREAAARYRRWPNLIL